MATLWRIPQKRPAMGSGIRSAIQLSQGAAEALPSNSLAPTTAMIASGSHQLDGAHQRASPATMNQSDRWTSANRDQNGFRESRFSEASAAGICAEIAARRTVVTSPMTTPLAPIACMNMISGIP